MPQTPAAQSSRHSSGATDFSFSSTSTSPSFLFGTPVSPRFVSNPTTPVSPTFSWLFDNMALDHLCEDLQQEDTDPAPPLASPISMTSSFHTFDANFEERKPRTATPDRTKTCLESFDQSFSPWSFFEALLMFPEFAKYQQVLYRTDSEHLEKILHALWDIPSLQSRMLAWFRPHMLAWLKKEISDEFDVSKQVFFMASPDISAEWLVGYDYMSEMNTAREAMPVWNTVLTGAARSSEERKREEHIAQNIITSQLLHLRSRNCCKLQHCMGLFSTVSGASQQLIETLNHCSLSTSRWTVQRDLTVLADTSVKQAALVSQGPHGYSYDNYNDSMSIHVEQRPDAPNKVQSGTLPLVYKLRGVDNPRDCLIDPIMAKLKVSRPLRISDIRPHPDQLNAYAHQSRIHLIKTLFEYEEGFDKAYQQHSILQYRERHQLSPLPKTEFFPLRMALIEEASIEGNLNVHEDSYLHQMKQEPDTLSEYAIVTINDQLTNARIWSTQAMVLRTCLLGKDERLAGEKPDYHAMGMAYQQILDGLILNAWRLIALSRGFKSIQDFIRSCPSPQTLYDCADGILKDFATPLPDIKEKPPTKPRKSKSKLTGIIAELFGISPDSTSLPELSSSTSDMAVPPPPPSSPSPGEHNFEPMTSASATPAPPAPPPNPLDPEADEATSAGDVSRIEDILPDLAMIFRGCGSNKYAMEILYYLNNLFQVWTPEFARIMKENSLVNVAGLKDHFMGIDRNIEQIIGELKQQHASKGKADSWDRLADLSAAIKSLRAIKDHFRKIRVAEDAARSQLQEFAPNQMVSEAKLTSDARQEGYEKIQRTTLPTFNKNMRAIITRGSEGEVQEEDDEIPPAGFGFEGEDNGTVNSG
ncbi:hypothetical protein V5O48_013859 [Marasmius crinis-equi]|uniref:DUF6589 domain-containing protein n=1 Tax=Marasmius crinis-equi TaxID=585013 RepID=A0ABR3EYY1_9AGAR